MRKARSISLGLVLLAAVVFAHYPAKLKIDEAAKKQPPVTFDHAKHGDKLAKNCETCHHTQKGLTRAVAEANKVEIKKCSECHLNPAKAGIPSMREMSMTKNPMHIRCMGCHKEQKKGPTVCNQCHVKS